MIIVQTPLRVSLFGGGTDFPAYYLAEGGCVLSTAIDKYIFVIVKNRFDRKLRVGYTITELVDDRSEIRHELIREAFFKTGINAGVEISTMGDIPSAGSGLGSSSTVTVGALHAAYTLKRRLVTAEQLAREACEIEIDVLGKPIGVQDQYIAAYGGLRYIEFSTDGQVSVKRFEIEEQIRRRLTENTMLFYTGVTRRADGILAEQSSQISDRLQLLRDIKQLTVQAGEELSRGNVDAIGPLLHESWVVKKGLASKISNSRIDEMYEAARRAGATGGKVSGAGGGGFLFLYCPHEKQDAVRQSLQHLRELPFRMEPDGSKVIFNYRRD